MGKIWPQTRRGAKKFAREVELGRTYYSVEECVQPWGNEFVAMEWVFDHRSFITGSAMSGAVSAEAACLRHGPITEDHPSYRDLFDNIDDHHMEEALKAAAKKAGDSKKIPVKR